MVSTEPPASAIAPSDADIEDALVFLVRQIASARTWRRIATVTGIPLDRARYIVLRAVAEHAPARTTDLAEQVGVDQSTMSRHVAQLERAGYVQRVPDADDRRASSLSLTPAGRRVMERVVDARHDLIEAALTGWSDDDRAQVAPLLARLANDFHRTEERA